MYEEEFDNLRPMSFHSNAAEKSFSCIASPFKDSVAIPKLVNAVSSSLILRPDIL
jgi:hypothetical protein